MAAVVPENQKLLRSLADFEKEIAKANNLLKENSIALSQSLSALNSKAKQLEEIVSEDETAKKTIETKLGQKTAAYYGQLSAAVVSLKSSLSDFEEQSLRTEVFLESFRHERIFSFEKKQTALDFLLQCFSLYSVETVVFRPEFLGMVDLKDIAEKLQLSKGSQQLVLEAVKLPSLFEFFVTKNVSTSFFLESNGFKALVKNLSSIKIDTDNARLKRLERLAKEIGAKID